MKIKNVSNKVINVGPVALLPDKAMTANAALCAAPVIKYFEAKGMLKIVNDKAVGKNDTVTTKDVNEANKAAEAAAKAAAKNAGEEKKAEAAAKA